MPLNEAQYRHQMYQESNGAPMGYGQGGPYHDRPQPNGQPGGPRMGDAASGISGNRNPAAGPRPPFPSGYTSPPPVKNPYQKFFNPFANPLGEFGSQQAIFGGLNGEGNGGFNANANPSDIARLIQQALGGM